MSASMLKDSLQSLQDIIDDLERENKALRHRNRNLTRLVKHHGARADDLSKKLHRVTVELLEQIED